MRPVQHRIEVKSIFGLLAVAVQAMTAGSANSDWPAFFPDAGSFFGGQDLLDQSLGSGYIPKYRAFQGKHGP
jgi:hypothetical protein